MPQPPTDLRIPTTPEKLAQAVLKAPQQGETTGGLSQFLPGEFVQGARELLVLGEKYDSRK